MLLAVSLSLSLSLSLCVCLSRCAYELTVYTSYDGAVQVGCWEVVKQEAFPNIPVRPAGRLSSLQGTEYGTRTI